MSKVAHALYLLCDHIIWFSRVGLMDVRSDQWLETANRYVYFLFSKFWRPFTLHIDINISCKEADLVRVSNK